MSTQAKGIDTKAALNAWSKQGFVLLEGIVDSSAAEEVGATVLKEWNALNANGLVFAGGGRQSGHIGCFPGAASSVLVDQLAERGVLTLFDQLVGTPVVLDGVGCNLNLPGSRVQHYHIDGEFEPQVLVVNIALVDTNLENGAIDLVPGSFKKFYRYYDFVTEGLARSAVRCSMRRGDILIRSSAVWHRGMPNLTAVPRPMMALGYQPPAKARPSPANFTVHGGRVTFTPNFYDTSIAGRAKEFVFVRVPFVHSTLRFVKSMMEERRAS